MWVYVWSKKLFQKPYKPFMKPSFLNNSAINMKHRIPDSDNLKLFKVSISLSPMSKMFYLKLNKQTD